MRKFGLEEIFINYSEVVKISDAYLLPLVTEWYGLEGYEIQRIPAHDGGRNVVYAFEKEGGDAKILRIAFLPDRSFLINTMPTISRN